MNPPFPRWLLFGIRSAHWHSIAGIGQTFNRNILHRGLRDRRHRVLAVLAVLLGTSAVCQDLLLRIHISERAIPRGILFSYQLSSFLIFWLDKQSEIAPFILVFVYLVCEATFNWLVQFPSKDRQRTLCRKSLTVDTTFMSGTLIYVYDVGFLKGTCIVWTNPAHLAYPTCQITHSGSISGWEVIAYYPDRPVSSQMPHNPSRATIPDHLTYHRMTSVGWTKPFQIYPLQAHLSKSGCPKCRGPQILQ
jgi:hypothetical protein